MLLELDNGAARQEPEAAFPGGAQNRTLSLALAHGLVYHVAFAWLSDSFSRLLYASYTCVDYRGSGGHGSLSRWAQAQHPAARHVLQRTTQNTIVCCPGLQGPSVGGRAVHGMMLAHPD